MTSPVAVEMQLPVAVEMQLPVAGCQLPRRFVFCGNIAPMSRRLIGNRQPATGNPEAR